MKLLQEQIGLAGSSDTDSETELENKLSNECDVDCNLTVMQHFHRISSCFSVCCYSTNFYTSCAAIHAALAMQM